MSYQRAAGYGDDASQWPSRSPSSSSSSLSPSASSGNENGGGRVHSHSHGHASTSPPEIPDRSHRRAASISKRSSYSRPPGSSSHLQPSTSALSASPEAPSTLRRMPKSAVYSDLASTARGSWGDPPQTSYSSASSQISTPKSGAPREYQPDSPLTPTMASQTLPRGASGASHRDRERTPFATPDRSIYASPSASTDISAISRSREASVSSISSLKTGTTPKPLHEPPILMPSSTLETASSRSHLSYPTVHSSGSSAISESYDDKSDSDSGDSYGWSGLDDPTLQHEPTKSPLFGEEASGSGYTDLVLMGGVTTARLRTPSPPASRSGVRRTRSISKSDAVDGDPAAWWTSSGSGKRLSLMSLKATDLGAVRAETPAAVPEEIENGQALNFFGIAYIPTENINSGVRLSAYEPQRPSSARSRTTTPDYVREQSPSRPSGSAAVPEQAAVGVQDFSPLSDPSLAPPFVERPQMTTRQQPLSSNRSVERPALLGPKSSSSSSDEVVIPPKSPNRQPSPSLQRDASSQSLSESVDVLSFASPTTSTMVYASPQVGGSPNSQAIFAERKAKRHVSAPAPRPQKSRHRASASRVGEHKFDHETKTLAPMSTQANAETASPSSGQLFELGAAERIAARPTLTRLSPAEPRFSGGRGQLNELPMSASDFTMSYGEFDAVTPIDNHKVDQHDEPSTRTSHVRSPAVADEPIDMDLAPSSTSQPTDATPRLATVTTPSASSKRPPTRSEAPKDGIQNPASLYSQLTDTIADAANLEHDLSLVEVGSAAGGLTSSEREPLRSASTLQLIDRPGSVAGLSDVNSARASSPGFSSEDVFHDATAEDGVMSDVKRSSTCSDLSTVPAPASITPLGLGGLKLDAKARAAAFVADLKRARTAASGSSNDEPPAPSAPLMASPMTPPVVTTEPLGITVSSTSPTTYVEPESPREVLILEGHSDSGPSQRLDAKPSSPARASPASGPPSFSTDKPRPLTPQVFVGEEPLSSQSALPPAQPLAPIFPAISIFDRTPLAPSTIAGLPAPYDPPPLAAPEPPPPSPPRLMLRRRRPLPPSLQIINDLQRTRTAGERANLYAMKIRELRKETSGIATWVGFVQHGVHERMNAQTVSQLPRHSRDEGSSATFPTRPDATCARELPPGSFTRQDLVPTVPFPGVLGAIHHSPSSSLPGMSSPPSSSSSTARFSTSQLLSSTSLSMRPASAIKDKASFFTSLGRRSSRRESASAAVPTSSTSVAPPSRRLSVSAPFNAGPTTTTTALTSAVPFSSVRAAGAVAGPRPIGGASSLHPGPSGGITTSSAPIPVSAPSLVPSVSSNVASKTSHESLNGTTNRTSFINVGGQSAVSEARDARTELLGEEPKEEDDEETKEKIQRLVDILPYARPEQIRSALRRANGDDVLAISIFLSDDQE